MKNKLRNSLLNMEVSLKKIVKGNKGGCPWGSGPQGDRNGGTLLFSIISLEILFNFEKHTSCIITLKTKMNGNFPKLCPLYFILNSQWALCTQKPVLHA